MKKRIIIGLTSVVVLFGLGFLVYKITNTIKANEASKNQLEELAAQKEVQTKIEDYANRSIRIKLPANVKLANGKFEGGGKEVAALNELIKSQDITAVKQVAGTENLGSYYTVETKNSETATIIKDQIKSSGAALSVYDVPKLAPLPTADYTRLQTYTFASPVGVSSLARSTSSVPGIKGDGVTVLDVEFSWNMQHEDLQKSRPIEYIKVGTPLDPYGTDHGTAVLGVIGGSIDGKGVDGIAPDANLAVINSLTAEDNFAPAKTLAVAKERLKPGDILLLELQMTSSNGLVPLESLPEAYDAIMELGKAGIIVIEAAGNGGVNLDSLPSMPVLTNPDYFSPAIMVGAGEGCNPDYYREWLSFSNYGKRVDVQGVGDCVVTTAYGDLYKGSGLNSYYTSVFSGTSSSSAVIAGIAAVVSSTFKQEKGRPITPAEMKDILIKSGTPQNISRYAPRIGPLPNVAKAVEIITGKKIDVPTPSVTPTPTQTPTATPTPTPTPFGGIHLLQPVELHRMADKIQAGEEFKVRFANGRMDLVGTLTITNEESDGYITIYPCGQKPNPITSSASFSKNEAISINVMIPTNNAGEVCFMPSATVHLMWDNNASTEHMHFNPISRLADTRSTTKLRKQMMEKVKIGDANKLYYGALTIYGAETDGYLSLVDCSSGNTLPKTSNINYSAGKSITNSFLAITDLSGNLCMYTSANTHVIFDGGIVENSSGFYPNRQRITDDRLTGSPSLNKTGKIHIGNANDVYLLNFTTVPPYGSSPESGYIDIGTCGKGGINGATSIINTTKDKIIANQIIVVTDSNGDVCSYNTINPSLIIDSFAEISMPYANLQTYRLFDTRQK